MKLFDILRESVGVGSAMSSLRGAVGDYVSTLNDVANAIEEKGPFVGRKMAGLKKAKWVENNYLSSKRFGVAGLQQAAKELSKRATKSPKAKAIFDDLANIMYSSKKESGRGKIFSHVGDSFKQLGTLTTDDSLKGLIGRIGPIESRIDRLLAGEPEAQTSTTKTKGPKDALSGQQNAQAEQAFQAAIASLPKELKTRIMQDTSRMPPSEKLKYLRNIM